MEDFLPGLSEARLDALIAKALAGEADAAELFVLRRWLGEHGVDLSKIALPGGVSVLPPIPGVDVTAAWTTVVGQLNEPAHRVSADRSSAKSTLGTQPLRQGVFKGYSLRRGLWSAAALVLGLAMLVVGWTAVRHSGQYGARSSLVYTTGNGERATITLPDGGTVALNVASRLEVPVDYLAGNHTVWLSGEGLFVVPHQDGAPFTVLVGTTAARVLGTSFVVRHYATDAATMVAVRDGKVAVDTTVVTAAHLVEVGGMGVSRVRPSDASSFTFAAGVLTLDGVPLSAAIAELDRWYDADIRLGRPSLAVYGLRGEFPAGSIANLVEDLEIALDVRVVRDGRVLTLYPRL